MTMRTITFDSSRPQDLTITPLQTKEELREESDLLALMEELGTRVAFKKVVVRGQSGYAVR